MSQDNTELTRRTVLRGLGGLAAAGAAGIPGTGTVGADHGPDPGEPVALQYFYEDWQTITDDLDRVAEFGFDAIWIQAPQKSRLDREHPIYEERGDPPLGYQPVDLLDFNSWFGTEGELRTLIQTAHTNGLEVYVDTVMNHMAASMDFDNFPQFSYADFHNQGGIPNWAHNFDPNDERCFEDGEPRDPYRGMCDPEKVRKGSLYALPDLKQDSEYVRTQLYNYMEKIADLGADGYRFDAVKNMPRWFFADHANQWAAQDFDGMFRVGEVFTDNVGVAQSYADTGMNVFDYPLYFAMEKAFNPRSTREAADDDMRNLKDAGLVAQDPFHAMPIVESHDTTNPDQYKLAHAFVLTAEGYPMLYNLYADELLSDDDIRNMVWVKKNLAGGATTWLHTDEDLAIYQRGDHLLVGLNNNPAEPRRKWVRTSWINETLNDYSGTAGRIATGPNGWTQMWIPGEGWTFYGPTGDYDAGIVDGATYAIRNRHSGKALDVAEISGANGADVHQWDYLGGANQRWTVQAVGDGYYRLLATHSSKSLDVEGSSTDDGDNVVQWEERSQESQHWDIQNTGTGYRLIARHSEKCLEVSGWSVENGGTVQQWNWHGNANQRWDFQRVGYQ
jgi:alpha-amylase